MYINKCDNFAWKRKKKIHQSTLLTFLSSGTTRNTTNINCCGLRACLWVEMGKANHGELQKHTKCEWAHDPLTLLTSRQIQVTERHLYTSVGTVSSHQPTPFMHKGQTYRSCSVLLLIAAPSGWGCGGRCWGRQLSFCLHPSPPSSACQMGFGCKTPGNKMTPQHRPFVQEVVKTYKQT